jgi:hypothetical protein
MPWYDLRVRRKKVKHSDTRRRLCRCIYMVVHSRQSQDRIMITEHLNCGDRGCRCGAADFTAGSAVHPFPHPGSHFSQSKTFMHR